MTQFETYALIAFFIGVVVKRFINAQVGDTIEVIAAVLFVLAWLLSVLR
jgi:ABC-type Mn2+/Zn2+ transport system permease subunit